MTIQTIPAFYFIDPVGSSNQLLDFLEPNAAAIELTATIAPGSRSMTALMSAVEVALNDAGTNNYSVTFDRTTRIVTISADDDFNLLANSGSNAGLSAYSLLGFPSVDQTGTDTYDGTSAIGTSYSPQMPPQNFKSFDDNLSSIKAAVNESADGVIEVISFGTRQFMEMNFKFVTEKSLGKSHVIEESATALSDLRAFLTFAILKTDMEFMIDRDNLASFDTVLLESTRKDRKGTSFEIRELIGQNLNGFYETGTLKFRKVT